MSEVFDEVSLNTTKKDGLTPIPPPVRRIGVPLAFSTNAQPTPKITTPPLLGQSSKETPVQDYSKQPLEITVGNGLSQQAEVQAASNPISEHPSPPPIYTAFYPPGAYPAGQVPPAYEVMSGCGGLAGRPAYIIDASGLGGAPTYILRGDQQQSPVYIISGTYSEFARRKRVGDKAICVCGEELKSGKSAATSHLSKHLNTAKHKEAMESKGSDPSLPKKAKLESIATIFHPDYSKQLNEQLTSDLTDFIVDSNLPFSVSESPFLRCLIKKNYGLAKLPSRHDVTAEVPKKASKCVESLRSFVKGQQISLTLDEFSHKEHSLFCITGFYLIEAFQFRSKVLAVESFLEKHSGDNIAEKINAIR